MTNNQKKLKVALVCTRGGHFEQMTNLSEFYSCYDHFWITNKNKQTENQLKDERVHYIELAHFKKPWTYLFQLAPVLKIFAKEKPTHVLSTGSGRTALIPFITVSDIKKKVHLYRYLFAGDAVIQSSVLFCSRRGTGYIRNGKIRKMTGRSTSDQYSNSRNTALNAVTRNMYLLPWGREMNRSRD